MKLKLFWKMLKEAGIAWSDDKAPRMGAALAYYSVFSLAPLLLIAIAIAGMVLGEGTARNEIINQIRTTVGDSAAAAIEEILKHASQTGGGAIATVLGVAVLLFGASGVFVELQDALNTIWKVRPRPDLGWWEFIRVRLLSIVVILITGLLLLVSLVVSAALMVVGNYMRPLAEQLPGGTALWLGLNALFTFAFITLLLAMIYRILPDADIGWRDVWIGAAITALLFAAGRYAIGLYLSHSTLTSGFGAAASVIIVLTWVYYSAQIVLFGAEFTRVYARETGSRIKPSRHAVALTGDELVRLGIRSPKDSHPNAANVPQPLEQPATRQSTIGSG